MKLHPDTSFSLSKFSWHTDVILTHSPITITSNMHSVISLLPLSLPLGRSSKFHCIYVLFKSYSSKWLPYLPLN